MSKPQSLPLVGRPSPRSLSPWIRGLILVLCIGVLGLSFSQAAQAQANPFPNRVKAPELEGGVEWLNTSRPLSIKELRGKIILLDFWTFCCINCMHILPDLKYLEQKYANELVVIGVHSAKFNNEKESGNIRKAILRYEIEHPVINDANMQVWNTYDVNSWPTLVLIDPEGFRIGFVSGEGNREVLDNVIGKLVAYHRSKGTLNEEPVKFDLEARLLPPSPLRFPGKVLADETGGRLFISDSNHNRIIVAGLDGSLKAVYGTGEIGKTDGPGDKAEFHHPQGMALLNETLYVADTENHMLRTIDLQKGIVETLAGTGEQASFRSHGGNLKGAKLNSPWDLQIVDDVLYIAMAGPHQLWSHGLNSKTIQPYAGSGREDILDGSLDKGAMAQPSGIAYHDHSLYVVDSEGSSVRKISTSPANKLTHPVGKMDTIVGASDLPGGRTLFQFGDVDGIGAKARLQHPLGIVSYKNELYVADSYNHKIKQIELSNNNATTWLGTGKPGSSLDPVQLAEPGGLTVAGRDLYIADTNNHRILKVDLGTKATTVFTVKGLTPPDIKEKAQTPDEPTAGTLPAAAAQVKADVPIELVMHVKIPAGYKFNDQLPPSVRLSGTDGKPLPAGTLFPEGETTRRIAVTFNGDDAAVTLPPAKTGEADLFVTLSFGVCKDNESQCKLRTVRWKAHLTAGAAESSRWELSE